MARRWGREIDALNWECQDRDTGGASKLGDPSLPQLDLV